MASLDDLAGIERLNSNKQTLHILLSSESKCHEQTVQSLHLYWRLGIRNPWLISQVWGLQYLRAFRVMRSNMPVQILPCKNIGSETAWLAQKDNVWIL